jgi:hypothetical protein
MNILKRFLRKPFFIKLFNWEYWSFNTVYTPIYFFWALLALRAKSFFFFSAANPTIKNGGFLMESKKAIYDLIPHHYYPPTIFFKAGTNSTKVVTLISQQQFTYPLMAKPDVGGRGRGVKKIEDEAALIEYAASSPLDYLVQQYIPYEFEVGIFYYRIPGAIKGHITGVVSKEFLTVAGDGVQTILQLLQKDKRFILQIPTLQIVYGHALQQVLPHGEKKLLVPYGNHARGAKFIDDSSRVDAVMEENIDKICQQVKGFYYGRLDVKYNTWEELRQGKNFSIIEVNGAGSEPTHMYDPGHSIFFAWKEIIRHWIILYRVSKANHKNGIPYMSYKHGVQMLKDNKAFEKKLDALYV